MYSLKLVPLETVSVSILAQLTGMISEALFAPADLEEILHDILTGTSQLWVDINEEGRIRGCGVTMVGDAGDRFVLHILAYHNRNSNCFIEHFHVIEEWAKCAHLSAIEFSGRRGWGPALRKVGCEVSYITMTKDLRK